MLHNSWQEGRVNAILATSVILLTYFLKGNFLSSMLSAFLFPQRIIDIWPSGWLLALLPLKKATSLLPSQAGHTAMTQTL